MRPPPRTRSTPAAPRSRGAASRSRRSGAPECEEARAAGASEPRARRGRAARLSRAAVPDAVEALAGRPELAIAWDEATPESFRLREEAVLRADLAQLSDALKALDKQMAQKLATRKRLDMSIAFQRTLMDTLNARVATRQEAIDKQVGTKINLYDAKEELEKSQSQLASDEGQLIETDAALKELQSEKAKTVSQFIADNENKLAEASRKADEAREALAKAAAREAHTRLYCADRRRRAADGGDHDRPGRHHRPATRRRSRRTAASSRSRRWSPISTSASSSSASRPSIKVDAFPFTRFGVLHGKVVKIASGAIPEEEAKRALANATAAANPAQTPPTAPGQAESFVFPVTVALDETAMTIDNAVIPLTPGMTVTVEIKTDSRRVIDYLLSPLAKIASEAARER